MGKEEESVSNDRIKQRRIQSAKSLLASLNTTELADIVVKAEDEIANKEPVEPISWKCITEYKAEIAEAVRVWGKVAGLTTGLPSLDNVLGGLRKGQILLIAGEPNQGKSAIATQIAVNVSKEHKVGYISLEMLPGDNGARINHMNGGTDTELSIDDLKLFFQSTPAITDKDLRPLFEQAKTSGIELIMLDYLQFLGRGMTNEEVAKMSQLLKKLALEFQLPFVVIVSLRKGGGIRKWTDVTLEDLMGTAAIGYDADATLVVSHSGLDGEFDDNHIYIKVLKLRNMQRTKDNEYLWFDWNKTKITEPIIPLNIVEAKDLPEANIDNGKLDFKQ